MSDFLAPALSRFCADSLSLILYVTDPEVAARCEPYLTWIVEQQPTSAATYFSVFGKTILLEAVFYFLLLRKLPWGRKALALLVANLATHPMVYFGFPWISEQMGWTYLTMVILAEIFAPTVETIVLAKGFGTAWKKTALWIVAANLFSWWVGVIIVYG